jgi:hypothetical protein
LAVCAAHVVKYFASMGTSFTLSSHDLHGLTCEAGVETEWSTDREKKEREGENMRGERDWEIVCESQWERQLF